MKNGVGSEFNVSDRCFGKPTLSHLTHHRGSRRRGSREKAVSLCQKSVLDE